LLNYNLVVAKIGTSDLGAILKRQRVMVPLTLRELAVASGISPSHLGRVERGERFPSAHILRKIAGPLGFAENELFVLAGYLSRQSPIKADGDEKHYDTKRLDPYVAQALAQEPVEVQRTVIGILNVLKGLAEAIGKE
jgi:transcriptional regulator with XRE-family HTH domain